MGGRELRLGFRSSIIEGVALERWERVSMWYHRFFMQRYWEELAGYFIA